MSPTLKIILPTRRRNTLRKDLSFNGGNPIRDFTFTFLLNQPVVWQVLTLTFSLALSSPRHHGIHVQTICPKTPSPGLFRGWDANANAGDKRLSRLINGNCSRVAFPVYIRSWSQWWRCMLAIWKIRLITRIALELAQSECRRLKLPYLRFPLSIPIIGSRSR